MKRSTQKYQSLPFRYAALAVVLLLLAGCDSSDSGSSESQVPDSPVRTGAVTISIETTGVPQGVNPYGVVIDLQSRGEIEREGELVVEGLPEGNHDLTVSNVSPSCAIPDLPSSISITGNQNLELALQVVCPTARIAIDEGHFNTHTLEGTYDTMARLLAFDGYVLSGHQGMFTQESLADVDVLIISNALNIRNVTVWKEPIEPAFAADEVDAVRSWVEAGGALMLVADHMPFPGAVSDLAASFGVTFVNGFAFDPNQLPLPSTCLEPNEVHVFRRVDGEVGGHFVTEGRSPDEQITAIGTFTGQAFPPATGLTPVLIFTSPAKQLLPTEAWEFPSSTPEQDVSGWMQGGVMEFGAGRVAFLGEAAMFTNQSCFRNVTGSVESNPMGMQAPQASQNSQFLKNVIYWLAGFSGS